MYAGVDEPQSVAAKAVRQIIERFCGGSVEQLLVGMVNNRVLDERCNRRVSEQPSSLPCVRCDEIRRSGLGPMFWSSHLASGAKAHLPSPSSAGLKSLCENSY